MAMCLPVAAQKSAVWRDSFNAGVNYSLNVGEADIDYNGVAINAGYRKFLYGGLFVMPEVSLYWQQYKYEYTAVYDYAPYPPGSGIETPPHQNYSERRKESLDRFGIGADALVGIRVSIVEKVGIDLMAGPYIGWSFANNVDGFDFLRCRQEEIHQGRQLELQQPGQHSDGRRRIYVLKMLRVEGSRLREMATIP